MRNRGQNAPIQIIDIATDDPEFKASGCIGVLAPGASCQVAVTFTPNQAGSRSGNLTVNSNATNPVVTVPLRGVARLGKMVARAARALMADRRSCRCAAARLVKGALGWTPVRPRPRTEIDAGHDVIAQPGTPAVCDRFLPRRQWVTEDLRTLWLSWMLVIHDWPKGQSFFIH